MDSSDASLGKALDVLYREHPAGFVAARDQLARELRADGSSEAAERVKRLRRPTLSAWMINRASIGSPDLVEELAAASGELETAQRTALEGDEEAATGWRDAAARERAATAALIQAVGTAPARSDIPPAHGCSSRLTRP